MSSVTIQMPPDTVQQLASQGYSLIAFKAVQISEGGPLPALWYQTQSFSTATTIGWTDGFTAFTSLSQIVQGGQIPASASYPARIGSTLMVTAPDGTGSVSPQGSAGAISIENQTQNPFICGIGQTVNGQQNILCAAPLYGEFLVMIAPVRRVLLMITAEPIATGTLMARAPSEGILVDFTAPGTVSRTVNFDIDNGWSWGGGTWGQLVFANSDLIPLLIQNG